MKAAIYARYSSDLQTEKSIIDQIALCRTYAEREGLTVIETFEDRALSGASVHGRFGLDRLMRAAADERFSVVIVESLDRLSRDQGDLSTLYKRLTFLGIEIREVHGGKATPLNTAVRGLVGAIYLTDLADKIRRGMSGLVREGRFAGGRPYGYQPVPGQPGKLTIVETEAEVIRRIFAAFAAGSTPRTIAGQLNAEGIAPPRGTRWNASTIHGSRGRGNGILGNEIYAGALVWNKVRMIKNPDTGKRVSRVNPEREWQRREMLEARIVSEELWAAVQRRRGDKQSHRPWSRTPRHPLSGLLRCHLCGSTLVVHDNDHGRTRVMCSTYRESRSCRNSKPFYLDRIEAAVLETLKAELDEPAALTRYVATYNAEYRRLDAERSQNRTKLERRLIDVTGEIDRTAGMMIKGLLDPERHAPRVRELESEERALKAELSQVETPRPIALHPQAISHFSAEIDRLAEILRQRPRELTAESVQAIRALVTRVTAHPDYHLEIEGKLSELVEMPMFMRTRRHGVSVVAEARYAQHPTFVLRVFAAPLGRER